MRLPIKAQIEPRKT